MSLTAVMLLYLITAYFLIYQYGIVAKHYQIVDIPNHRSSHTQPIIRGSGLVFALLWLVYLIYCYVTQKASLDDLLYFLPGCLFITLVGFIDDINPISATSRLICHALATCYFLKIFLPIHPMPLLLLAIHSLLIMWSINLFNFMDGIDGIAAIESLFFFGMSAFFFHQVHADFMRHSLLILTALIGGFLLLNAPPARTFMGDAGSTFLGYVIALIIVIGNRQYHIPLATWFILYSLFIYDATITLLRRIKRKDIWYQAHRQHAFQRLHQAGWPHKKIIGHVVLINSVLALLAYLAYQTPRFTVIYSLLTLALLTGVYLWIENKKPM